MTLCYWPKAYKPISFKELLPVLGDRRQHRLLPRPRLRPLHPRATNQVLPFHEHPRFRHRRR